MVVRRKAGAEVEFGNTLLVAENKQGLIIDWDFFEESAPADSALLGQSVGRMQQAFDAKLKAVGADRGFDSQTNQIGLAQDGIYTGVCPRSVQQLEQRSGSWKFKHLQRRRAQTKGRVGIIKNRFSAGRKADMLKSEDGGREREDWRLEMSMKCEDLESWQTARALVNGVYTLTRIGHY